MHVAQGDGEQGGGDALSRDLDGPGVGAASAGDRLDLVGDLQLLGHLDQGLVKPGVDVGAEGNGWSLAHLDGLRLGDARLAAEGGVNGDGRVGGQAIRAGDRAAQANLLLHSSNGVDVPGMSDGGKPLQANQDGGHCRPVVEGLPGHQISFELRELSPHRHQIAHSHQARQALCAHSHVYEQFIHSDDLLAFFPWKHMGRTAADDARQIPASMHCHFLTQEGAHIEAAH